LLSSGDFQIKKKMVLPLKKNEKRPALERRKRQLGISVLRKKKAKRSDFTKGIRKSKGAAMKWIDFTPWRRVQKSQEKGLGGAKSALGR